MSGLLAAIALCSYGCVAEAVAPEDPARVAEGSGAQPAPFHVRDSGFVHVGIGQEVSLHVAAAAGAHPLRFSARDLVPTSWTSRDTSVASVRQGALRGRTEGLTWLVWSQSGVRDSVALVVSAAPVRYLTPRLLTVAVGAAAVEMQAPAGDSLQFCANPPVASGVEISGVSAVQASQVARLAIRCRMASGATAALVLVANADTTPAPIPDPVPPPPRVPAVREVVLQLHRFAGAEQATVTSSAVPLPPGWVRPASVDSISLLVGGTEVPVHVAALFGKHRDGSLRSVLVQASITPEMVAHGATLLVGALRTTTRPALASIPLPNTAGVLLPTDVNYLVSTEIAGRTVSRAGMAGAPTPFLEYERTFDRFATLHWQAQGDAWTENFYDRAFAYFAFWVRTGLAEYWERGARLAVNYRKTYLEANRYVATEWWTQLEGVAMHYWLTGDPQSREAVYKTAESLNATRGGAQLANNTTHEWMDNRVQSKVLGSKVLSIAVEAPAVTGISAWRAAAASDLERILSTQGADGAYRWGNICGQSSNFMSGMLASTLLDYDEVVDRDARIVSAVQRNMSFLASSQWLPERSVFRYYSGTCATGGPYPADDLNGFFLEPLGWLAYTTGDSQWLALGDQVLSGMLLRTFFNGSKQFNQAYRTSWRYHWYRSRLLSIFPEP